IPKGSLVFANIKAMSLDENVYSRATSFCPERYLPKSGGNEEPPFIHLAFGFGRRFASSLLLGSSYSNSIESALACRG
ncbi:hypothetical protein B0H17DRAFT_947927, partial [Mycena rosella]